jgi:glycerophosphoryl diester phosphodiesterase
MLEQHRKHPTAGPRWLPVAALLALLALPPSAGAAEPPGLLEARAVLPASTLAVGPPSGAALEPGPHNGVISPFPSQPVQGFSGILPAGPGRWWAMPDNGYGRKENSDDFLLRIYRVRPRFKTAAGGSGGASVEGFIGLRDPDKQFPFPLFRSDRFLTGADVDPESVFRGTGGSFWVGDEFGPWMLHFDRSGRLLAPPISLAGVKSPQNPDLKPGEQPTLDRSKGFEAAAPTRDGRRAYVFLEGALLADTDQRRRFVYELDLVARRFTGRRWAYRTANPKWLVADAKLLGGGRLLVMERDDFEGADVRRKTVFLVNLRRRDANGFVAKREVVDLLDLRDPAGVSLPRQPGDRGLGFRFSFPLRSVESILPLGRGRLLVANDNNYPFDAGRHDGRPDGNEWIIVRLRLTLRGLRLSRHRFRSARRGRAVAPRGRRLGRRVGTRVRYRLGSPATVTFRVQRARRARGRLVGGRCVRRTRGNAGRRRCIRYRTLRGKFTHRGGEGVNRFRWTGRLRGRRLRPGRYRLLARARSDAGARSKQTRAGFRIVRR